MPVEPDLWVANLVAQHGDRATSEGPPIRYEAVRTCLRKLAPEAAQRGAAPQAGLDRTIGFDTPSRSRLAASGREKTPHTPSRVAEGSAQRCHSNRPGRARC